MTKVEINVPTTNIVEAKTVGNKIDSLMQKIGADGVIKLVNIYENDSIKRALVNNAIGKK